MTHIGYITLIPIAIIVWIALIVLIKNSLVSNTLIHVSDNRNLISNYNFNGGQKSKKIENNYKKIKYHVPKFMLELYEKNKSGNNNHSKADIVRSLIPKHAGSISDLVEELSDTNHLLIFDLPPAGEEERFVSAELKILTLVEVSSSAVSEVERRLKISVYDDSTKKLFHVQKIDVHHSNNTWLSFNVTQAVTKILEKNEETKYLKIVITIIDFLPYHQPENDFKLSLMPVEEDFEHDYPILLLSYTSNTNKAMKTFARKKRSIEEDYEEATNNVWDDEVSKKLQMKKLKRFKNTCRRRPLYISFAEIEYDLWIVQPTGYDAYQCQGKCFYPVAEHLNPTKHAIVQALLHSVAPSKASRSCCVPTALDSISILYVDSNGVLTYRYAYKDMVVLECGCR